jgi:hypothetical protein
MTFNQITILDHLEHISMTGFNESGTTLASFRSSKTRVWILPSGKVQMAISSPRYAVPLCMSLAENSSLLWIGCNDRTVRFTSMKALDVAWKKLNSTILQDKASIDGAFLNAPNSMAFNSDATLVAVSYHGFPLSVWGMRTDEVIKCCKRRRDRDWQLK